MTNIESLFKDERVVEWARVVVHTTGALGPNTPISNNHWSIYLLLANKQGSLRLNMMAEWDDDTESWNTTGILKCTTHAYNITNSRIEHWDQQVPSIPVGWICTHLWNKGCDAYSMSGGGSGCRYWVYTVIRELESQRYVSAGSAQDLYPKLLFRYSVSGEKRDLPMVYGEFHETGRAPYNTVSQTSTAAATSSSPTVNTTTSLAESSQAGKYFYVSEKKYYLVENGQVTPVTCPPINEWVLNDKGWMDTNREKKWRYWDGKKASYQ